MGASVLTFCDLVTVKLHNNLKNNTMLLNLLFICDMFGENDLLGQAVSYYDSWCMFPRILSKDKHQISIHENIRHL